MTYEFTSENLKNLWKPDNNSSGEDNGQVTIIGGSDLFTGAPLLSLVAASRLVDMVFLATPEIDRGAAEKTAVFSRLKSTIWIPRSDLEIYIEKSDAVLIGPGMMRYSEEMSNFKGQISKQVLDVAGTETRMMTQYLLTKFPKKKWVIDGGSLQVIKPDLLPAGSIITPNKKEYQLLFEEDFSLDSLVRNAKKYSCVICHKGPISYVSDGLDMWEIKGGNAGLTKGGTGDVQAGMTVGLFAKNPSLISACTASYIVKKTADYIEEKVGTNYNADDVSEELFTTLKRLLTATETIERS